MAEGSGGGTDHETVPDERTTAGSTWGARLADPTRVGALSDGLFAIVLTLLVLDIDVPESLLGPPLAQATALWPSLFGYMLTFVIAGIYWTVHHRFFAVIERVDWRLLWINLMFLLCVGLLPFPTGLLSHESEGAFAFGWLLYSINMLLIGVTLTAVLGYAAAAKLVSPSLSAADIRGSLVRSLVTPAAFALSVVVVQFNTTLATLTPILILPGQFLLGSSRRRERRRDRRRSQGTVWSVVAVSPIVVFVAYSVWVFSRGS